MKTGFFMVRIIQPNPYDNEFFSISLQYKDQISCDRLLENETEELSRVYNVDYEQIEINRYEEMDS